MENQTTKEVAVIDQVKEVVEKSGVPLEIDITELFSLSERAKAITSVEDPNFAIVKKEMQQKRIYLKEYFMDARRGFNKMAEGVIQVQNAVLAEFTPEEERLIELDKAEKERVIKEARLAALPAKRERITTAGIEFTDEEILAMTDADFEIEYNTRLGAKLESDRIAADEKRAAEDAERQAEQERIDAEKAEIEREKKQAKLAIYNSRVQQLLSLGMRASGDRFTYEDIFIPVSEVESLSVEDFSTFTDKANTEISLRKKKHEEAEADRIAKEKEEAVEAAKKEAEEKAEREKKEAEEAKKKKEEEEAQAEKEREADKKYQAFLKKNKYDENNDIIIKTDDGASQIYRFVAEFNKE